MKGFVPVPRNFFNEEEFSGHQFSVFEARFYLLLKAVFKPKIAVINRKQGEYYKVYHIPLEIGQLCISQRNLAKTFSWDTNRLKKWLLFEKTLDTINFWNYKNITTIIDVKCVKQIKNAYTSAYTTAYTSAVQLNKGNKENNLLGQNKNFVPDGTILTLSDGTKALKYFGQWVDANNKSVHLDLNYYSSLKDK